MISLIIPTRNSSQRTCDTVARYLASADASDTSIEVVIVDDGSSHEEREALKSLVDPRARIVLNDSNLGRGAAVNAGVREALGKQLLIVDCDCPPSNNDFLALHVQSLQDGAHISVGALLSRGKDFWSLYQDEAALRRAKQFASGIHYVFTSQNIMIDARWFNEINGFDERYTRYGFEDRDFFIRLIAAGARIAYTPGAGVIHEDSNIRLATVAPKMRDAGAFTSPLFRKDHPAEYSLLGYAAVDSTLRGWLNPIAGILGGAAIALAPKIDPWLQRIPFVLAKPIATAVVGLAFMYGTTLAAISTSERTGHLFRR